MKKVEYILRPFAEKLVLSSHVPSWVGQENDIVEDAVQETIMRIWKRIQLAERGEADQVTSPEKMGRVILYHYLIDLRRHDIRLLRLFSEDQWHELLLAYRIDTLKEASEDLIEEELLYEAAGFIVTFPEKQLIALLTHLANDMEIDEKPTRLQKAFLKVGVRLEDYRRPLPEDRIMRARHATMLSTAYKRLSQEFRDNRKDYISA